MKQKIMDKNGAIIGYIGGLGLFGYLGLSAELTMIYLFLMFVDTLLRYIAEGIHGKLDMVKAKDGILRKFSLLLIIFAVASSLKAFNIAVDFQLSKGAILGLFTLLLIMFEIHSIFNKLYFIRTGECATEKDPLSVFIKKLLNVIGDGIDLIEKKILDKFR